MKLIMCEGLPGSGKSTWAKEFVTKNPEYVRVNKDEIRAMLGYRQSLENFVLNVRDFVIERAFAVGKSVIVDDTNLHPKHEARLSMLAKTHGAKFEVQLFTHIPLEQCIENDLKRPNSVGAKVIKKMYNEFLAPTVKAANWTIGLDPAIIVDIDGTVALHVARGPFDIEKCGTDKPNKPVVDIVKNCHGRGFKVLFVSGREEKYRGLTDRWMVDNLIPCEKLFMRPTDDKREDSIVKQEIYEREIKNKYNIFVVLDDRNRVVDMWRRNGLTCLQVADGDF